MSIADARRFTEFVCIDWSGARGSRQPGIALAHCREGDEAPILLGQPGGWSRSAVLDWLIARAAEGRDMLIGFDFSASLPFDPIDGFLPGYADVPRTARGLWAWIDRHCLADPHLGANAFVEHPDIGAYYRLGAGRQGRHFGPGNGRLRLTEQRCRDHGHGPAQSSFNLVGAAQVGKASLTGMRLLHRLDGRIPVWPFDTISSSGPLIVEIYTTIAARRAGITRGSKLRDRQAMDATLSALCSTPHSPLDRYDDHSTDAILAAAWLRRAALDEKLWHPRDIAPVRHTEGWTFGVP